MQYRWSLIRWELSLHIYPLMKICSCTHSDLLAPWRYISEYMWGQQHLLESKELDLTWRNLQAASVSHTWYLLSASSTTNTGIPPPPPPLLSPPPLLEPMVYLGIWSKFSFHWKLVHKVRFLLLAGIIVTVNLWRKKKLTTCCEIFFSYTLKMCCSHWF